MDFTERTLPDRADGLELLLLSNANRDHARLAGERNAYAAVSYIAKLRLSVLRAAAQRIADEIDNPRELEDEDSLDIDKEAA